MLIPGSLISLLTFPGVIVHEVAHQLFCRLMRVAVLDVCYFRAGNPAGYVVHETPKSAYHSIMIGLGPFILNSLLGALIAMPAAIPVLKFESAQPIDYFLIWLGVSIAMHAFPSNEDAAVIYDSLWSKDVALLVKLIAMPLVVIIDLGSMGSIFWLDLLYGIGLVVLIPTILVKMLA